VLQQWFISAIDGVAPAAQREARQQLYAEVLSLHPIQESPGPDDLALFILAQVLAAHHLATSKASGHRPERASAHATWYEKERLRVVKLLGQIAESPVVASFQSAVTYYDAADVTCPHGHNQKTCEAMYALRLTLNLLEQHQTGRWVRKSIERLRQREPHLPALQELCAPLAPLSDDAAMPFPSVPEGGEGSHGLDEVSTYVLSTIVGRLRQAGHTVGQSCGLVDRVLYCCFGRPDGDGTRPALLAEHWRRLHQQSAGV
jgi:hypothetical protein